MGKKDIDVRDQVSLSFEKSFRFCRKGISYRLFRSSLTLAVVVVAVAFFTVLLSEGLMLRSTSIGLSGEMRQAREADRLLMHLFHRYSNRDLSAKLAAINHDPRQVAEFAHVAGLSEDTAGKLARKCLVEQRYLVFFKDLSAGKRVVLVKKNTGRDIFDYLADKPTWEEFLVALGKMRSVRLPLGSATLRSFLDGRDAFMAELEDARASRDKTVMRMEAGLKELTGGGDTAEWIAGASDEQVEQWRAIVNEAGFDLDKQAMARARELFKVSATESTIARQLQTPEKREAWKLVFKATPGLEDKLLMLEDERVGKILDNKFSLELRRAVVERFNRMKYLRDLLGRLPKIDATGLSGPRFLDGRQMFLVVISFLVCMVGITNAMLMSITERFREIATMKCLGATDNFILKQFLIEAAIQGVVGGTAGMLIGIVISVLKAAILYGAPVFAYFPGLQMVYCAVFTVLVGIVLAMLASIYPSRAAASMAPMDAMRVE